MINMTEDILKTVHDRAENKLAALMVKVNLLLEKPDMYVVENLESLILQMAQAQIELNQAKNLYNQALAHSAHKKAELQQKLEELNSLTKKLSKEEVNTDIAKDEEE
jgi:hypothetical protein